MTKLTIGIPTYNRKKELEELLENIIGELSNTVFFNEHYTTPLYYKMKNNYDISRLSFWIIDIPLLFLPNFLFSVPYKIYRYIQYGTLNSNKNIDIFAGK